MEPQPGPIPRTPGAMNWVESIDYFIAKGKVSRAGIFDNGGKELAGTPDLQISDQDARAIKHCVDLPVNIYDRTKFGVFLSQSRYVCLKVDSRTLIGMNKEELFVGHRCDDVLIIAFVPLRVDTSVSCLGEVWTFAEELKSHMEVSQFVQ